MENGTYLAQFVTGIGHGHGVAIIRDNKVRGGDSWYWWTGNLDENADQISGSLTVCQHTTGNESVFGFFNEFELKLKGKPVGDAWQFEGLTPVAPGQAMQLNLRLLKSD